MTRILALSLTLAGALTVAGCQTPQQTNALIGGGLGAGAGAIVGTAVGGGAGGALAGAAIGGVSGAVIGSAMTPRPHYGHCVRWGYNANGRRVCVAWR